MNYTKVFFLLYAVLLYVVVVFLISGQVNAFGTIAIYSSILLVFVGACKSLGFNRKTPILYSKLLLSVSTVIITLCLADLLLLHIIRPERFLAYNERNGENTYYSKTLKQKFSTINKHFQPAYVKPWYNLKNKPGSIITTGHGEFAYTCKYNSQGLRNEEVSVVKKKNEVRVLVIGDSFTEGFGAPQDSTGPKLLEDILNKPKGDTTYTVINAGLSGSDPFNELYLLRDRLLVFKPDIVIVSINASDIDEVIERGGFERFQPDSTIRVKDSPWWEPLYGASMVVRLVVQNVFHYSAALTPLANTQQLRNEALEKLKEPILGFQDLAHRYNFKLALVFLPRLYDIEKNENPFSTIINSQALSEKTVVVNLFDGYNSYFNQNQLSPRSYYWKKDLHHNSQGYLLWAKLVHQALKSDEAK